VSTQGALWLGLVLLLGNAFFVGAEFALVSARRTKVEPKAAAGSRVARTTLRAMEGLSQMIAAAQFGITVCSLGLGAVAEPALAHLLEPVAEAANLSEAWVHPVAFTIAMSCVVYLHVVLGEMVPKNLALAGPERAAMVLGPPMVAMVTVLKPIVYALDATANAIVRRFGVEPRSDVISTFTLEEVEAMVDESHDEGMLDEGEYERLAGALGFTTRTVADVLLPLDQVETVERGARASDVELVCATTGYSRFPVVGDSGELVGYLHIKDVLQSDPHGRARMVEDKWIRPFAAVSTSDTLVSALQTLQAKGAHMARVVNEEGVVVGIATLEDVIEELVGEIRDAAHAEGH
jgi:CBS domain containing-hemolysin-like protein